MRSACGWYGMPRRCIIEHMRESWVPAPVTWPKAVLPPGRPGWESTLTAWLAEQFPADTWRHETLAASPWAAVITAAIAGQHTLAGLRDAFRRAGQMRGIIGAPTAKQLQDAITAEAVRLKGVMEVLFVMEHALTPRGAPPQAELGMRGPVGGGS